MSFSECEGRDFLVPPRVKYSLSPVNGMVSIGEDGKIYFFQDGKWIKLEGDDKNET